MAKTFRFPKETPILDIVSYGGGAQREKGGRLTVEQVEHIRRTVQRVPEVMVKVLPRASNDLKAAGKHLDYIGRKGELELETDCGERLDGEGIGSKLLEDWDLDIDEHRRKSDLGVALGHKSSKLVHKLMLSMPPGTPEGGVLAAARNFLREEFALKHRYAFVLHTDEPHPHVHAVVKAVSEQGVRLNIRKATLRRWRAEFAQHLREQGISANATERAVRGESRTPKLDGIYRAARRGSSTHMRARTERVAEQLRKGVVVLDPGGSQLALTRRKVERGWHALASTLAASDQPELAAETARFLAEMPPVRTEAEWLAAGLLGRLQDIRQRPQSPVR